MERFLAIDERSFSGLASKAPKGPGRGLRKPQVQAQALPSPCWPLSCLALTPFALGSHS